jgi:hypothetical protein
MAPTDTIVWYAKNTLGGAGSIDNADTITNTWGVVEHTAQKLTLTSSSNQYDLQYKFTNNYVGVYLNLRVWVKLGTASNFSIGISNFVSYAAGQTYTNANSGINSFTYTQVSMSFMHLLGQTL